MKTKRVGRPEGPNTGNVARRRKQLIDATVKSIVEHGLSATTLATVSRASGLSQGTAVFYFKTKETLLAETFRHRMDDYRMAWRDAIETAGEDPVDRIVEMTFASIDPRLLSRDDLALWNAFWPEASRLDSLHAVFEEFEAERQLMLRGLFTEARALLEPTLWEPDIAAQAAETMVEGIWVRLYYSPTHMSVKEALETMARLLSTIFPTRSETIMAKAARLIADIGPDRT